MRGRCISIDGNRFTDLGGVTEVTFGGTPGTDVVVSPQRRLLVTVSPHAAGIVDVQVGSAAGGSRALQDA